MLLKRNLRDWTIRGCYRIIRTYHIFDYLFENSTDIAKPRTMAGKKCGKESQFAEIWLFRDVINADLGAVCLPVWRLT